MTKPTLILVGGGGHCRSVIDVIEAEGKWNIRGVLDRDELVGQMVIGHRVIGTDAMIPELVALGHQFLITAGQVKDPSLRAALFSQVQLAGGKMATVVSPIARVAPSARLGKGSVVCHFAAVNSQASIADNCIVNTGAIVEHDAVIGYSCHIATGAVVNGGCRVGNMSFIGSRAVLVQAVSVGSDCVVGAGTVVLHDVPDDSVVVGQPARRL